MCIRDRFISDGCFILSSSITYYFLFSIFPIILILISISGIFIDTPSVKTAIFNFVDQNFPIAYEFTKSNIEKIIENRKGIGAVAVSYTHLDVYKRQLQKDATLLKRILRIKSQ